jgi:hypothetical protein
MIANNDMNTFPIIAKTPSNFIIPFILSSSTIFAIEYILLSLTTNTYIQQHHQLLVLEDKINGMMICRCVTKWRLTIVQIIVRGTLTTPFHL